MLRMRYMSQKRHPGAQNAARVEKTQPGCSERDTCRRSEHRVCNLRLLVRNTQENMGKEHRVCNLRMLARNSRENMENEHRVCNFTLLVRNTR